MITAHMVDGGKAMKIEKCPFCGKEVAEISNCQELEGCRHFEKCPATEPYVCVVCNMFEGGCGASSGYYDSAEKAISAWNRRAGKDIERLTERVEAQRWIPVSERLPEVGKCVLIRQIYSPIRSEHGEYEEITIGYLHQPTDKRYKPYFYWVAASDYGDMVRAESICPGSKYVTHWMPLPEPPKGE
jgi:hypothetical protein